MIAPRRSLIGLAAVVVVGIALIAFAAAAATSRRTSGTSPARPSLHGSAAKAGHRPGPTNIYAAAGPAHLRKDVGGDPPRVYVPNGVSGTVSVIDPATRTVVQTIGSPGEPQHIVPSYDLRTLWVLDNRGSRVMPIDAATGQAGATIPVTDPYNLYFTPDGSAAIVVAEAQRRLDFRDPHTMALRSSLRVPTCPGINHIDDDADGRYLIATCEFGGRLVKIDVARHRVLGTLDLVPPGGDREGSMPQDVRAAPDGHHFFVADMRAGGVHLVDGDRFVVTGFVRTGVGTHGLTPSRDGRSLYVANRGSTSVHGGPHGPGSVSVLDFATGKVTATWTIPGGGSPDMGNLDVSGRELWLSGRFDAEVYVFDTTTGRLEARIPVGSGPHGLTVWPQPGRFSLGHTGNMR